MAQEEETSGLFDWQLSLIGKMTKVIKMKRHVIENVVIFSQFYVSYVKFVFLIEAIERIKLLKKISFRKI